MFDCSQNFLTTGFARTAYFSTTLVATTAAFDPEPSVKHELDNQYGLFAPMDKRSMSTGAMIVSLGRVPMSKNIKQDKGKVSLVGTFPLGEKCDRNERHAQSGTRSWSTSDGGRLPALLFRTMRLFVRSRQHPSVHFFIVSANLGLSVVDRQKMHTRIGRRIHR